MLNSHSADKVAEDLFKQFAFYQPTPKQQAFHEAAEAIKSVVEFDDRELIRVVEGLTGIHASLPLTDARARFMTDLILGRRDRLRLALGG